MDVKQSLEAYQQSAKDYADAVAEAFPQGKMVEVTLGNKRIRGRVLASGETWWSGPGQISIKNIETGKVRRFDAGRSDVVAV